MQAPARPGHLTIEGIVKLLGVLGCSAPQRPLPASQQATAPAHGSDASSAELEQRLMLQKAMKLLQGLGNIALGFRTRQGWDPRLLPSWTALNTAPSLGSVFAAMLPAGMSAAEQQQFESLWRLDQNATNAPPLHEDKVLQYAAHTVLLLAKARVLLVAFITACMRR